jgi:NADH:ubiquinone oxidoreductase subunit
MCEQCRAGGTQTKLVGEDVHGNKYYEDPTRIYGRHRWVIYKNFNDFNASQVPLLPGWTGSCGMLNTDPASV